MDRYASDATSPLTSLATMAEFFPHFRYNPLIAVKLAKLKKMMVQAKAARSAAKEALKNISTETNEARNEFEGSRKDLKLARRKHKAARKHLRRLEKAIKAGKADLTRADEAFGKLERKWNKLWKKQPARAASPRRAGRPRPKRKRPPVKLLRAGEGAAATP